MIIHFLGHRSTVSLPQINVSPKISTQLSEIGQEISIKSETITGITLPKTEHSTLKFDGWKLKFPFKMVPFQVLCCYVSFPKCKIHCLVSNYQY